jgi:outer membrane lipoprotein SlyB
VAALRSDAQMRAISSQPIRESIYTAAKNALWCRPPSQNTPGTIRILGFASHEGVQHPGRQVEGIIMTKLKYCVVGAAGLALLLSVASVSAQQPVRVRGEIEKVDGNKLTIKSREGATVTVVLKDGAQVNGVEKAMLSDIKQNSFVGITAMPQPDGSRKAIEVHIFPESRRGAGEGDRAWDLVPNSTMTNANVEQLVTAVDGPTLTMKYKDGEKKIMVPNNATIVQFVSGDKSELKPGAKIFVAAGTKLPNGDIETAGINVGKNGITPPM